MVASYRGYCGKDRDKAGVLMKMLADFLRKTFLHPCYIQETPTGFNKLYGVKIISLRNKIKNNKRKPHITQKP
jgi:hypothetical protein